MSNLGPLPTDFLKSSGCEDKLNSLYFFDGHYVLQGTLDQTTCYPNGYKAQADQYYSPAICPNGFTQACTETNRIGSLEETISICCPTRSTAVWQSTLGCASANTSGTKKVTVIVGTNTKSKSVYSERSGDGMNAYSLQVRRQSTDSFPGIPSPSPVITSSLPTATSTTSQTSGSSSSGGDDNNNKNNNNNNNNTGISTGAAVGITLGVVAGISMVIAGIWYLMRQKRRQRQRRQQQEVIIIPSTPSKLHPAIQYPSELHDRHMSPSELRGHSIASDFFGENRYELGTYSPIPR
ncbi:hypothetical protein GGR50DRAFT_698043 [Xylaria sp. CBS 124048]|nr:hypothetical protein GGR50DRAFT_698043 [Xylaria sp. CBS 124048]